MDRTDSFCFIKLRCTLNDGSFYCCCSHIISFLTKESVVTQRCWSPRMIRKTKTIYTSLGPIRKPRNKSTKSEKRSESHTHIYTWYENRPERRHVRSRARCLHPFVSFFWWRSLGRYHSRVLMGGCKESTETPNGTEQRQRCSYHRSIQRILRVWGRSLGSGGVGR